jgi:hypothetical protein
MELIQPQPSYIHPTIAHQRSNIANAPAGVFAEEKKRIETPDWVKVKPGDDDIEEARMEVERLRRGGAVAKRARRSVLNEVGPPFPLAPSPC